MSLFAMKPAAPARVHLMLAGTMWAGVGLGLAFFGCRWIAGGGAPHSPWLQSAAGIAGLLKSRIVLDRVADRIASRILIRGNGRCIGGFLSIRSWALVVGMAVFGRLLRSAGPPACVVGTVYLAVGTALLASSRRLWRECFAYGRSFRNSSR